MNVFERTLATILSIDSKKLQNAKTITANAEKPV